jgi:hypothetical protein
MVAPARRHPALTEAPARHPPSRDCTGRDWAGPATAAAAHTGRTRPDPGLAARLRADPAPRRATPGRGADIPVAARMAPRPAAAPVPGRRTAVPAGPVPGRGSSGQGSPVAAGREIPVPDTRAVRDTPAVADRRRRRPRPAPGRRHKHTARAAAGRRIPRGVDRAGVPGAAGPAAAGPGEPAGGGDPPGAAGGARRPASRPRAVARAGPPIPGRTLPACLYVAGSRTGAACRAPAGSVTAPVACPRDGAARVPCRPRSSGSPDQRDRRRLPGRSPAGKRPGPRRPRHYPGRVCLGQARCPDDSPGTSWTHRAALATPIECRAVAAPGQGRRVIVRGSTLFYFAGQQPAAGARWVRAALLWGWGTSDLPAP